MLKPIDESTTQIAALAERIKVRPWSQAVRVGICKLKKNAGRLMVFSIPCKEELCILGGFAECPCVEDGWSGGDCDILKALHNDYVDRIMANDWISPPDMLIVKSLAAWCTAADYFTVMVNAAGGLAVAAMKDDSRAASLYGHWKQCDRNIEKRCKELGLTPTSRAKLGVDLAQADNLLDTLRTKAARRAEEEAKIINQEEEKGESE